MEWINKTYQKHPIHSVIFDFDGTISLIRQGWQEIMTPYFTQVLMDTPNHQAREQEEKNAREFIDLLTGKQTIYQCIRLKEEVEKREGHAKEPIEYKDEYHRRLLEKINDRRKGLEEKTLNREDYIVPGSIELLEFLKEQNIDIYLASGTDHPYVVEEAKLLGVDSYFDGKIYGAKEDYKRFSKAMVIQQILKENQIDGKSLAGFGDGYVEIENVKEVGGLAIGVASDEEKKQGIDEWKRERLIRANADVIIGDFNELESICSLLLGE